MELKETMLYFLVFFSILCIMTWILELGVSIQQHQKFSSSKLFIANSAVKMMDFG